MRGVIQQVGTPDEIYEAPGNLFVARFIGAPAMNVFDARLEVADGRVAAVHAPTGVRMDLSAYRFSDRPEGGQPVAVGLRPEHFAVGPVNGAGRAATFELPLRYSERSGADATAFLEAPGQLVAVRIEPARMHELQAGRCR